MFACQPKHWQKVFLDSGFHLLDDILDLHVSGKLLKIKYLAAENIIDIYILKCTLRVI